MQVMQKADGEQLREVFAGYRSSSDLTAAMDGRRKELEAQGYTFIGRIRIGRNDPCPCQSGRKFKRCCISLVKRDAGVTYVKLPAAPAQESP